MYEWLLEISTHGWLSLDWIVKIVEGAGVTYRQRLPECVIIIDDD